MDKSPWLLIFGIVFSVSFGAIISLAGADNGSVITFPLPLNILLNSVGVFTVCGLLAFSINWLAYIPAAIYKTEKYYDLVGSITYLTLIAVALVYSNILDLRAVVVAIMVLIWACRLGIFLFVRVLNNGHDDRFDDVKVDPLKFFLAWTLQALWVLVTVACALVIITSDNHLPLGITGMVGIGLWLIGFIIEVISDQQKRVFRQKPENKNRFITTGLWAFSQHPNYFGEIVLWFGMSMIALPILEGWQILTLVSPVFVFVLLTKGSGIPTLQEKALNRWGRDPKYQAYIEATPILIPLKWR